MSDVIAKIDDIGRPAWIALMVASFIIFWPLGLLTLAFLIGSGRMGCGRFHDMAEWQQHAAERRERWQAKWADRRQRAERFYGRSSPFRSSGNSAFDEYREETLRRLEAEANEFRSFLDQLRNARDKSEFDDFMTRRRAGGGPQGGSDPGSVPPTPQGPTPTSL